MHFSLLNALFAIGYLALRSPTAVAQPSAPLPYANAQVEPDQESSPLGVATDEFKAVHRPSPSVRGVRGADGVVYWVSRDNRVLTAYRGKQQVWQTPVADAFRSQLQDAQIETLVFASNTIFVTLGKTVGNRGFAEVNRQTGQVQFKDVESKEARK
jgi:outer membrane protein assembly factor BamB